MNNRLKANKKRIWSTKLKSNRTIKAKLWWGSRVFRVWQDLEFRGLTLEVIGLLMAFIGAGWQAAFTDWYDSYPTQSQAYAQEVAHGAILTSLSELAYALDTDNQEVKRHFLESINKVAGDAHHEVSRISDQSEYVEKTQGDIAKIIKLGLLFIGLLCILMGKYYIFRYKVTLRSAPKPSPLATPPS
jgi:membrane protein required for beta-lactamase induction